MKSMPPSENTVTVRELLKRRLLETEHSQAELAEAVQVPEEYIADLIAGRRRPPRPARTDVYDRMTSFLKLGRNEIVGCATAEIAGAAPTKLRVPGVKVRAKALELCEPKTAQKLEKARQKDGGAQITDLIQRLLDIAQRAVRRKLADQVTLRLAAERGGGTYVAARFKMLEFLDTTSSTLTAKDITEFMLPLIATWDVDSETGVLRVVLRGHDTEERIRRAARIRPAV